MGAKDTVFTYERLVGEAGREGNEEGGDVKTRILLTCNL